MSVEVSLKVNGIDHSVVVKSHTSLLSLLRDHLGLTGTNMGCGTGECGACTVMVDGKAVNSCLMLAVDANGRSVETIEGMETPEGLHPLQEAFLDEGAVQCGFCTPGMIMVAKEFLDNDRDLSSQSTRKLIEGNLCRCTGYKKIVSAIQRAKGGGGDE